MRYFVLVYTSLIFFIEYENRTLNPYFGGIIGRVANRISNAKFNLDGVDYNLDKNDGNNTLHGGKSGYNWVNNFNFILIF